MENLKLQLYSVRDYTEQDFAGTIRKVAEFGYKGVEFAGYGGLSARELKKLLDETGLEAAAAHIGFDSLKNDLDSEIEYAQEAGIGYIVCPYLGIEAREDTLAAAEVLAKVAARCKEARIGIAYHNHAHEFVNDQQEYLLDILFANAPDLACELDVYWVAYAGIDVVSYMSKFKDRLPLIHLKELGALHSNVDIGKGILDFPAIIRAARGLGTKHFIVEQEEYEIGSMASAKSDIEYLKNLIL
ncbi:MAG: sugar phosphate isomerase/epimerase family protein [Saccharofermentanales bacterium]